MRLLEVDILGMPIKYAEKLNKVEQELLKLKKGGGVYAPISLKGILKGVSITEKDIQNAKKSLFKVRRISQ